MSDETSVAIVVLLAVATLPLFWWGVVTLLGAVGGWRALAAAYAAPDAVPLSGTPCWRGQSGTLNGYMNYNGVLQLCADPRGLGLATMVLFRPGHPRLLVPWSEIAVTEARGLFGPWVELRFSRVPRVVLRIRQRLARAVADASGGALRLQPPSAERR